MDAMDHYVGDVAQAYRGGLRLSYPIKRGIIDDWRDLERILHHTFYNEARITPEHSPLVLSEAPLSPKANREKITTLLFERYGFPKIHVAISSALVLYSVGKPYGLVMECGGGISTAVPIYSGYVLPHAVKRVSWAGMDVTDRLLRILSERGVQMTTTSGREIIRDMKVKLAYVSRDFATELAQFRQERETSHCLEEYALPDTTKITIGDERFRAPEILFQPSLAGKELDGIHKLVTKSIQETDIDLREEFYKYIVLSGGTTLFQGLPERLHAEVQKLAPPNTRVRVEAPGDRRFAAWIGGSILSQISSFQDHWITQAQYRECGPSIAHRKWF